MAVSAKLEKSPRQDALRDDVGLCPTGLDALRPQENRCTPSEAVIDGKIILIESGGCSRFAPVRGSTFREDRQSNRVIEILSPYIPVTQ